MSIDKSQNPKNLAARGRVDITLLPAAGVIHGSHACMQGAEVYGPYNWRDEAIAIRGYLSADLRHLFAFLDGQDIDPKSGCHHLGHLIATCSIILDAMENGSYIDDRPAKGPAADIIERINAEIAVRLKEESGGQE